MNPVTSRMAPKQLSLFRSPAIRTPDDVLLPKLLRDRPVSRSSVASNPAAPTELSPVWSVREREAWAPPRNLRVSECAERYRILPSRSSASSGPWTNRAYYAVEVMDSFADSFVERITVMASVQSSKTESVYNMLFYAIHDDPGPALVVMPTLSTLRRVNKRILSMIRESPEIADKITRNPDDLTRQEIHLENMTIHFATAGSTADLRNVEARYVLMDETDDYLADAGGQGSPVEMAEARSTTYWNRKIITCCTPTHQEGYINIEYERSDRRRYWVPCPHCGGYQVLSFWKVKHKGAPLGEWPKDKRGADYIKANRVARYECEHCGGEIDDRDKAWMLRLGTWLPEGHGIERDGTCAIPRPRASHVGFTWNALYSPWRTFSDVAAQYFATKDDPEKYRTFVNLWLAEPWRDIAHQRQTDDILALCTERPALVVPAGTVALTAGIDNQRTGKWVVIRAWQRDGLSVSSHLVRWGFVESWEQLEQWIFQDTYTVEDSGIALQVWRGAIDIGGGRLGDDADDDTTMTEQVYDWLRRSGRGVVYGVKGLSRAMGGGRKMKSSLIDKMPGRNGRLIPGGIRLWLLDTGRFKDAIWSHIETGSFRLHADVGETYARQLTSEVKTRDNRGRASWTLQGRKANHLFDAEVYAAAMADPECDGGVLVLAPPMDLSRRAAPPLPAVTDHIRQNLDNRTMNPWRRTR